MENRVPSSFKFVIEGNYAFIQCPEHGINGFFKFAGSIRFRFCSRYMRRCRSNSRYACDRGFCFCCFTACFWRGTIFGLLKNNRSSCVFSIDRCSSRFFFGFLWNRFCADIIFLKHTRIGNDTINVI